MPVKSSTSTTRPAGPWRSEGLNLKRHRDFEVLVVKGLLQLLHALAELPEFVLPVGLHQGRREFFQHRQLLARRRIGGQLLLQLAGVVDGQRRRLPRGQDQLDDLGHGGGLHLGPVLGGNPDYVLRAGFDVLLLGADLGGNSCKRHSPVVA